MLRALCLLMLLLPMSRAQSPASAAEALPRCQIAVSRDGSPACERLLAALSRQWPAATYGIPQENPGGRPLPGLRRALAFGAAPVDAQAAALPLVRLRPLDAVAQLRAEVQRFWPHAAVLAVTRAESHTQESLISRCEALPERSVLLIEESALNGATQSALLALAARRNLAVATTAPLLSMPGAALSVHADSERTAPALIAALLSGRSLETAEHCVQRAGVVARLHATGALLSAETLGALDLLIVEWPQ